MSARLCKDCRWMLGGDRCGHRTSTQKEVDLVNGRHRTYQVGCWLARSMHPFGPRDLCGPHGKHWEPREVGFGEP
jgi:hypothetical protein